MNKLTGVHAASTVPAVELLSSWWDDECVQPNAVPVDHLLSLTDTEARHSLRCYSLIGAALRHEQLDARDISTLVAARLAKDAAAADQLAQDLAHAAVQTPVIAFPQSRLRRSMTAWRGAIAASFVAGMVGIGVWMMPSSSVSPPESNLQVARQPETGATPIPIVARVSPGMALPAWAQATNQKTPMDPYLMTHFESVSPDLSEVMPSLRMISFKPSE
ncbi:hypothetical protein [Halothiobacillus sp. DCM-1]|uniref:hypothetical protein n=1 Tax=Halothiobacillus sp. DCM-1 TaxID=3112558 RepID=UPI00324B00A6